MTFSTRRQKSVGLVLFILISQVFWCSSNSPPGKPFLKQCHSPDKETFTCRWEPDANDGPDTTYHLLYEKEQTNGIFECPDYHTAGKNSCFFDKNHTSVWIDYFLTVVAINTFGNTTSDAYKIDVANIVKPNPPENVTLRLELSEGSLFTVHITWNPYNIGTKYGWVTPKYELRFKQEDTKWNIRNAGLQTHFSLYSVTPGKMYMVQVRCALDNGAWSEWSDTVFIQVPKSQWHRWILVPLFSALPLFAAVCIILIKRKTIKQWLLPPVPRPKIKGVDVQLLKNGRSEEVTSALLLNQVFPPVTPWKYQTEEYLVVCDDNMLLIEDKTHINEMISIKIHPKPNINNHLSLQDNLRSKEEVMILDYLVDNSKSGLVNELNNVNTMDTEKVLSNDKINTVNVNPVDNSSYLDIQRQEVDLRPTDYSTLRNYVLFPENPKSNPKDSKRQEESLPDDYTKVKEVNSENMVLLHDLSSRNNAQCTDCSSQKSSLVETGKVITGYVDNILTPVK